MLGSGHDLGGWLLGSYRLGILGWTHVPDGGLCVDFACVGGGEGRGNGYYDGEVRSYKATTALGSLVRI